MVCRNCNYDNPEGSAFCQVCGQPLSVETPAVQQNAAGPKPLPFGLDKKKIIGIVAALAAVVVLILIISAIASSGSEFIKAEAFIDVGYNSEDKETSFVYNSAVLKDKVDGSVTEVGKSADGSHAMYSAKDDSDKGSLNVLYHVSKSGVKKVADGVKRGDISLDGSHGYYIDEDNVLYSCDLGNGKNTKVAEDVEGDSVIMSPDGKTLLYRVIEEDEDEDEDDEADQTGYGYGSSGSSGSTEYKLHAWKNGKDYSIGKDYSGKAVSNDGKYVFISNRKDGKNALYVTKIGSDDKVKLEGDYSSAKWNYDRTECLFMSDGKLYISVKGKEPVKVGSMGLPTAIPALGYSSTVKTFLKVPVRYTNNEGSTVIGFIQKSGKEYEFKRLASNVASCENVGDDTLYFLKSSGDLCKVKIKADAEDEDIAEDIESFDISKSGKIIYALDDDETLWKISGKKKDRVSDDVYSYGAFGNGVLYMTEYNSKNGEGELYYSSNGKNKTKIAEDVIGLEVYKAFSVAFYANSDNECYISGNAKKFDKIF